GSGSRVTWPDGVSLELDLQRLAGGVELTCRAAGLPVGLAVDGIGVSLRRHDVPGRILIDGYQSWDWAGVRDARLPGRGWWSAVWGDEHGGGAVPIALHLSQAPTTALTLAWERAGSLDVLSCAEPQQTDHRTGLPGTLVVPKSGALAGDPIAMTTLATRAPAFGGPPSGSAGRATTPLRGWMSWNCLGGHVSARDVRDAARDLVPAGGVALLDDGWMPCWGDWTEREGFGATLPDLAVELAGTGRSLGVWLAPFLAAPDSRLVAGRPELLLRDAEGASVVDRRPVLPHLVLDGAAPAVAAHLRDLGARLAAAGVGVVKLDFLYAGALPGAHAGGVSGTMALRQGLEPLISAFRARAAPPAMVLGCGAPLPPIAGLVDACRSGGDAVINVPNSGAEPPPHPWFAHGRTVIRAQTRNLAARAWLWGEAVALDVDAVTMGAVGDMPEARDDVLEAWIELARRSGGPFLVSDRPEGVSPGRLERLHAELERTARGRSRPRDPLGMAPAPMVEDVFYAWPEDLPEDWVAPE
ncbi:MAG TPA: hypothetical protein VI316_11925, partial [Candidatus Dormibacteraeota bacterium]